MFRALAFTFGLIFLCISCLAIPATYLQLDNQIIASWGNLVEDPSIHTTQQSPLFLQEDQILEAEETARLIAMTENSWWVYEAFSGTITYAFMTTDVWALLEPYLLPGDHPIKHKLDRLFQKKRVTQSLDLFEQAGFRGAEMRKPTNIVVGKHPDFSGYLFKVFLDTQPPLCDWAYWLKRIEGAQSIQACIQQHGFQHFRVPQKWIYPLPDEPSPPNTSQYHRKNFILIVEDMDILSKEENLRAFKKKMTPQILQELHTILTEEGLIGSVYPKNIPFTRQGDLAFIDTEHHHIQPVPYHKLTHFLSSEMKRYWQTLID